MDTAQDSGFGLPFDLRIGFVAVALSITGRSGLQQTRLVNNKPYYINIQG